MEAADVVLSLALRDGVREEEAHYECVYEARLAQDVADYVLGPAPRCLDGGAGDGVRYRDDAPRGAGATEDDADGRAGEREELVVAVEEEVQGGDVEEFVCE